jgi:predicted GNAT family acetyltransferase
MPGSVARARDKENWPEAVLVWRLDAPGQFVNSPCGKLGLRVSQTSVDSILRRRGVKEKVLTNLTR